MTSIRHMQQWLPRELLVTAADDLEVAGTYNINHIDCPAGTDTRKRLYVTVKEDGTILGYCHHCGQRGFVPRKGPPNIHGTHTGPSSSEVFHLANIDLICFYRVTKYLNNTTTMSMVGQYIDKWSINTELAEKDMWYFGVDRQVGYVMLFPYYTEQGNVDSITGCQVRYLDEAIRDRHKYPKIKTYGKIDIHIFNPNDSETLIICEDRVSGLRIAEAGFAACVMNGSGVLNAMEAHSLSMMFDHFIVWYDNDNAAVIKNANMTQSALLMFSTNVSQCALSDPKKYEPDVISNVVLHKVYPT